MLARKWADSILVVFFSGIFSSQNTTNTLPLHILHPAHVPKDIPHPHLTKVFFSSSCWQGPSGPISGFLWPSLHIHHLTDIVLEGFSFIFSMRLFLVPLATSSHFRCKHKRLNSTVFFPLGTSLCPLPLRGNTVERRKLRGEAAEAEFITAFATLNKFSLDRDRSRGKTFFTLPL